ncbi:hypothetical protein E3N88_26680 [Mikania micrantha]|uniref:Integrase catalytic domain-containing protein n=1 Tax=Mikania micrantha TaxID=192012 RepID=A0A5N6MUH2_9ASTR|nr:hypothetical protein E3N88_26680 [Mikania micrantha]
MLSLFQLPVTSSSCSVSFCEPCAIGKSSKLHLLSSTFTSSNVLDLIISDVWGPSPVPSSEGHNYFLLCVDHFSKFMWIFPLKRKSDVFPTFKQFLVMVERQFNTKLKQVQTDWGGEFRSLSSFFQSLGILHRLSCPHTSEQNGVVERRHRHVVETGLTLLAQSHVPPHFWQFAYDTAVYLINRMPSRSNSSLSPFQHLFKHPPDYSFLRVFGSQCFPHLRPYNAHKMEFRSTPCVFLGYSSQHHGYRCLDPETDRIYIARHVRFNELCFPFKSLQPSHKPGLPPSLDPYTSVYPTPPLLDDLLDQTPPVTSPQPPHPDVPTNTATIQDSVRLCITVTIYFSNVAAVESWPVPSNVREVRGFLGLTGYYRRFIRGYGIIARPLTNLTKKEGFLWSEAALQAFNTLKQALMTAPILCLPDFSKTFTVECDASSEGVGAILTQDKHPIAYFSKGFSPSNRLKSAYDRELLALVLAVQKWNHYLMGHHFLIKTDHYTLKFLLEQRVTTTEQQRLLLKLMPYDFSIIHRSGSENKGADALSRRPQLFAISLPHCLDIADIRAALEHDPYTFRIVESLTHDSSTLPGYTLKGQLLYFKGKLVVPNASGLRDKLIQEAHATPSAGHGGYLKTLKRLSAQFYWPNLSKDVRVFIQQCVTCQRNKYDTLSPAGLLQPLPIPQQVWEDISLDFITGLPSSHRFDTILVVVDRLSKYAHFLALSHPFTAKSVASLFCKEIVRLHGFPRSIVSDRDPVFLSSFWQELFRLSQTKLKMSTSYHPQTDGQTEPPFRVYTRRKSKSSQAADVEFDQLELLFPHMFNPFADNKA